MMWNRSLRGMVVAAVMAAVLLLGACTMMDGQEATAEAPVVAVEVADGAITVPDEVPSGVVSFDLSAAEGAMPARLNDGVTVDQLNEALAQPDPFAALGLVSLLGGGSNTTDGLLTVNLTPGDYAMIYFADDGPPATAPFSAGEPSGASAPSPDVTVDLVDFDFTIPAEIESGPKLWQINNKGQQWHEMVIVQLTEGASIDDVLAMLQSEEEPAGPPPFEQVAFWSPNGPGETGYVTWDLAPGEYTVICFLPDIAGDMSSHAAHGMVASLMVTE